MHTDTTTIRRVLIGATTDDLILIAEERRRGDASMRRIMMPLASPPYSEYQRRFWTLTTPTPSGTSIMSYRGGARYDSLASLLSRIGPLRPLTPDEVGIACAAILCSAFFPTAPIAIPALTPDEGLTDAGA